MDVKRATLAILWFLLVALCLWQIGGFSLLQGTILAAAFVYLGLWIARFESFRPFRLVISLRIDRLQADLAGAMERSEPTFVTYAFTAVTPHLWAATGADPEYIGEPWFSERLTEIVILWNDQTNFLGTSPRLSLQREDGGFVVRLHVEPQWWLSNKGVFPTELESLVVDGTGKVTLGVVPFSFTSGSASRRWVPQALELGWSVGEGM